LGRLTIVVEGPREGVIFRLDADEVPVEVLGVAAPADPGHRVLVALRGETEVARAEVDVPEGDSAEVAILVPAAIPDPEDTARTHLEGERSGRREPIETGGGIDVGLLALGITVGVLAIAAVIVTVVVVMDTQGPAPPIEGNLSPAVIVFE
jgi:hypothetical protein